MKKDMLEVVVRAQQGDEEAFEILYDTYYRQAYGRAFRLCRSDADAKDAVQDAFFSVKSSLGSLRDPELFEFWLSKIVKTKCIKIFERNKDIFIEDEMLQNLPNQIERNKDYIPEDTLHNTIYSEVIHGCVEKLSTVQREVVEMMYFKQMHIDEIAEELGIPQGTVKSRLHQARKMLKKHVTAFEDENDIKVSFRTEGLFSFVIVSQIVKKLQTYKQVVMANSISTNAAIALNVVATMCVVGVIGIGAKTVVEDVWTAWNEPVVVQNIITEKEEPIIDMNYPAITVQNIKYDSPRDMYYGLLSRSSNTLEYQALYDVLGASQGLYWDRLLSNDIFKNPFLK